MTAQERIVGAKPLGDEGDDPLLTYVRSIMTDDEYRACRRGMRALREAFMAEDAERGAQDKQKPHQQRTSGAS